MGISFERGDSIAGYPVSLYKRALSSYLRTNDPGCLINLRSVFGCRRVGAVVYEECLDRGLIEQETGVVTEEGMVVLRSKSAARTPLAKAQQILGDFLNRIDALNSDPEAIRVVDQVWLFGSLMRAEPTVGDIDLAITRNRHERFNDSADSQSKEATRLIALHADAPQSWAGPWQCIEWLYRRALYGRRRHPLLAGVQEGTEDLESLGVPCQLIYDRARGGRVNDPILPRHPSSSGRSEEVGPQPAKPSFSAAVLRPMDARWISGYDPSGEISPLDIFGDWTEKCRKLFQTYPHNTRLIADGFQPFNFPWTPPSAKAAQIDGRANVVIASAVGRAGLAITLNRQITVEETGGVLAASFHDMVARRERDCGDLGFLAPMIATAALILAADAERIVRRMADNGHTPAVDIVIAGAELPSGFRRRFVDEVALLLSERSVQIEPTDGDQCVQVLQSDICVPLRPSALGR